MPTIADEPRGSSTTRGHGRIPGSAFVLVVCLLATAGCNRGETGHARAKTKDQGKDGAAASSFQVIHPERRDIRMRVVQPGTVEAFESTPVYSHIAGYVKKYNFNIGDRVKADDVLLDMWIPDIEEQLKQKSAALKRSEIQIRVTESMLRAAESRLETAEAKIDSAKAGVKRAQASYTRWDSEYRRLVTLVNNQVLDRQVRDETYRQFEEAEAARDQANAMVAETTAGRDTAKADRDEAQVNVEAARADFAVAQAEERLAGVNVAYGRIKAPYPGVITQRNISPGDYLQAGVNPQGRPIFVLQQTDPVRVFVGVPELAAPFIKDQDLATLQLQAIPGSTRQGKVVRSGFALNPTTRTLQAEIDIPNADGHLRPGMYVTVKIEIVRTNAWTLPSKAIGFQGGQNYFIYLQVDGKPVHTPVLLGPSDDTHTEVLRRRRSGSSEEDWTPFDGSESVLLGSLDALAKDQEVATPSK